MKALQWQGVNKLAVGDVPDPELRNPGDIIVKVRRSVTCGSDLHLLGGYIPFMEKGDVLGHRASGPDGQGSFQRCPAAAEHSSIRTAAPDWAPVLGSVRQPPVARLTRLSSGPARHCSARRPSQTARRTAPSSAAAAHLPTIRRVPSAATVQRWAAVSLQV